MAEELATSVIPLRHRRSLGRTRSPTRFTARCWRKSQTGSPARRCATLFSRNRRSKDIGQALEAARRHRPHPGRAPPPARPPRELWRARRDGPAVSS